MEELSEVRRETCRETCHLQGENRTRQAGRCESRSDIFRPRRAQMEIREETTLALRTKKEKNFSDQNSWLAGSATETPMMGEGRCAWRSEGPGWSQPPPTTCGPGSSHLCDGPGGQRSSVPARGSQAWPELCGNSG